MARPLAGAPHPGRLRDTGAAAPAGGGVGAGTGLGGPKAQPPPQFPLLSSWGGFGFENYEFIISKEKCYFQAYGEEEKMLLVLIIKKQ